MRPGHASRGKLTKIKTPSPELVALAKRLNQLYQADANAMHWLTVTRVRANFPDALRSRGMPLQRTDGHEGEVFMAAGLLGVLNSLHAEPPFYIVADYHEDALIGYRIERLSEREALGLMP